LTAGQTVSGTFTNTLGSDTIQVSADGTTWVNATAGSGTFSASGVTLRSEERRVGEGTGAGGGKMPSGTGHSYTLDTTAPAAVSTVTALSVETGDSTGVGSASDSITLTAGQTVSGTFTNTLGSDTIQVSADGTTWVNATAGSGTFSASGVTL